jgi:hypothetical protein
MEKDILRIAAMSIKCVYDGDCINQGSTEWSNRIVEYQGKPLQVLAIGGSDEWIDWVWNGLLLSWDGVKLCSYLSAQRILKNFKRFHNAPLLITGHSKSGPAAMYLAKKLKAEYCVSFAPARGFRRKEKVDNCIILMDKDDPVPKLGALSFNHPICERIFLPDDHKGLNVSDHYINHFINFLNNA